MASFDTSRLDQAVQQQKYKTEDLRQGLVQKVWLWLAENRECYQIQEAYLFGSVTRPGRFRPQSDVDLAVILSDRLVLFDIIGQLSEALKRDVDVIELDRCHFADRIVQTGIQWTQTNCSY